MKSKIAQRILDETPAEVRIFVRKRTDFIVRVHQLLKEKGWTQKELAKKLGKTPSEVSKILTGDHNITFKTAAKLEAVLGAEIVHITKRDSFHVQMGGSLKARTPKPEPVSTKVAFQQAKVISRTIDPLAA